MIEELVSQYISEFKPPEYEHAPGEHFFSRAIVRAVYKPEISQDKQKYITRNYISEIATIAAKRIKDDFVVNGKCAFETNNLKIMFVDENTDNEIALYFKPTLK